jgi:hypothetical protein
MRGCTALLCYLDPCDAARLLRKAKVQLSRAIRLMRRVMRSDGFPETRRRIKLSQWNTVHGDRGQLRNGQSSPAAHPFGSAFIGVGEQCLHPPGDPAQVGIACLAIRPAWIAAAPEAVALWPTFAGEL